MEISKTKPSGKRYTIFATLGMKLVSGYIIRDEKETSIFLDTKEGVRKWIEEQQPFCKLTVFDELTDDDITSLFSGYKTIPSRYAGMQRLAFRGGVRNENRGR